MFMTAMQPPQDFEVSAPDAATMKAAIAALGGAWDGVTFPFDSPSGKFPNGDQFALHVYGTKYLPTGATTTDAFGNQQPVMAAQTGVFGIARYIPAVIGNTPPTPSGVTVIPLSSAVGAPSWE
jgi:hypothetical protein